MEIWFADIPGAPEQTEFKLDDKKRLFSYFDTLPGNRIHKLIEVKFMNTKIDLFLDSGAFSAFTQGVTIDLDEYIQFIKKHKDHLEVYANLDVIGDPEKTLDNQKKMEAEGLTPIPCFHYGEPVSYLEHYLKTNDYIAFGGMAADKSGMALSNEKRAWWLDDMFCNYICGSDGIPKVKVHGFGMTSFSLMLRYPWYSVDSTSWAITGRLGTIFIPRYRQGGYIYDENCWKVCVSSRSPNKTETGKHIDTFPERVKETFLHYIHEKGFILGKSEIKEVSEKYELKEDERWLGKAQDGTRKVEIIAERGISNDYKLRDEINIQYFLDLEASLPAWPWPFEKAMQEQMGFGL